VCGESDGVVSEGCSGGGWARSEAVVCAGTAHATNNLTTHMFTHTHIPVCMSRPVRAKKKNTTTTTTNNNNTNNTTNKKQYISKAEDSVLGVVEDRQAEHYRVNVFGR
jgi:hypothetical protein